MECKQTKQHEQEAFEDLVWGWGARACREQTCLQNICVNLVASSNLIFTFLHGVWFQSQYSCPHILVWVRIKPRSEQMIPRHRQEYASTLLQK
eukprot:763129-Hanusia_phi.AAC.7